MSVADRIAAQAAAVDYAGQLTDTCTIQRYAVSAQGSHGTTGKPYSDLATDVACRYDAEAARVFVPGTDALTVEAIVFFAADQDVTQKDRLVDIVRNGTTILTGPVEVIAVGFPSGTTHHLEAKVGAVKGS